MPRSHLSHGFEGVPPHILDAWRMVNVRRPLTDPGPEWLTLDQLAALWGIVKTSVLRRLRELNGQVERSKRQIINKRGHRVFVTVYRLKRSKP